MEENWIKNETPKSNQKTAQALLNKIKKERRGKKFKMVRVDEKTIKEVEIK